MQEGDWSLVSVSFRAFKAFDGETRYTPEAVAGLVGRLVPVTVPGQPQCISEILAAAIDADGWVVITLASADLAGDPDMMLGGISVRIDRDTTRQ